MKRKEKGRGFNGEEEEEEMMNGDGEEMGCR